MEFSPASPPPDHRRNILVINKSMINETTILFVAVEGEGLQLKIHRKDG